MQLIHYPRSYNLRPIEIKSNKQQECIPVGCVPPESASRGWGVCLQEGVCSREGVSAPGGVCSRGRVSASQGGVCSGGCWGCLLWGVSAPGGRVSAPGGGCLLWWGGIPACTEADTPTPL